MPTPGPRPMPSVVNPSTLLTPTVSSESLKHSTHQQHVTQLITVSLKCLLQLVCRTSPSWASLSSLVATLWCLLLVLLPPPEPKEPKVDVERPKALFLVTLSLYPPWSPPVPLLTCPLCGRCAFTPGAQTFSLQKVDSVSGSPWASLSSPHLIPHRGLSTFSGCHLRLPGSPVQNPWIQWGLFISYIWRESKSAWLYSPNKSRIVSLLTVSLHRQLRPASIPFISPAPSESVSPSSLSRVTTKISPLYSSSDSRLRIF